MKWRGVAIHLMIGTFATIVVAWACVLIDAFEWQRMPAPPAPLSSSTQSGTNVPTALFQLPEVIVSDVSTTVTVPHTSSPLVQRPGWMGTGANAVYATEVWSQHGVLRHQSQSFDTYDGASGNLHITIDLDTLEAGWPFRSMSCTTCTVGGLYAGLTSKIPWVQGHLATVQQAGLLHQPLTVQSSWFKFFGLVSTQNFPLRPILLPFVANTLIFATFSILFTIAARTFVRWFFRSRHGLCSACGYDAKGLSVCPECAHPLAAARPAASETVIPLSSTH